MVVHGFTGAPGEVRWLGRHLNRQGYTVYGPRLAGHGTTIRDMARTSWREWYADVLAGYHMLRANCDRVFVLGLSMGGALAFALAGREAVDGVVGMSSVYRVAGRRWFLWPLIDLFTTTLSGHAPPQDERLQRRVLAGQQARGEEPVGHVSYPTYPMRGASQLAKLTAFTRAGLANVTAPVLLVHSRADDAVPFEHMDLYRQALACAEIETLVLEKSGHVVTEDVECEAVFRAAAAFIAARAGG
jgi:carboxylesterase